MSMSLQPRGSGRYSLAIYNPGPHAATLALAADGDARLAFALPPEATVPAGTTSTVDLAVRSRRRGWGGKPQLRHFSVSGSGGNGQPPLTVTGTFEDRPRNILVPVGGGLAAIALIGAAAAGFFVLAGGDDGDGPRRGSSTDRATRTPVRRDTPTEEPATRTPTPGATRTPSATPRSTGTPGSNGPTATRPASTPTTAGVATPVPATATPVPPTATRTQPSIPANSIVAGEWQYSFRVTGNSCGSGANIGDTFAFSLFLQEVEGSDGYITDGEVVDVFLGDEYVGEYDFSYPIWNISIISFEAEADEIYLDNVYTGPSNGFSTREDFYTVDGVECSITSSE